MLKEMLSLLEKNARIEVTDLAALLNTDEKTVNEQIRECEEKHIIAGYHTIINWDNTNTEIVKAMIAVSSTPERDQGYDHIAEIIASYPEVASLYLVSGRTEFMLIINAATMREIADFVAHRLAPIEGVRTTETMFILKEYKVMGELMNKGKDKPGRLLMTL
ncbi:MAG TPA: Lrp/AsnC family transcriptional regulator [Erysipelotrichaceae bacterium]|jgi:DNA-binding Lrp family transcriptional regulator|nr:Lrp/AsnC family transcriptional regulator [Erysipelotrichaceae bacterium]HQB32504.1 Lrp/AsnC family transcriptional regulator [Erysipelotrichaceae bacterium]